MTTPSSDTAGQQLTLTMKNLSLQLQLQFQLHFQLQFQLQFQFQFQFQGSNKKEGQRATFYSKIELFFLF